VSTARLRTKSDRCAREEDRDLKPCGYAAVRNREGYGRQFVVSSAGDEDNKFSFFGHVSLSLLAPSLSYAVPTADKSDHLFDHLVGAG
jgi:hypothetical protein